MRPCFLPCTGRPGKKRMAEGEQKGGVRVRSVRTKVGGSWKDDGEVRRTRLWGPRHHQASMGHVCVHQTYMRECRCGYAHGLLYAIMYLAQYIDKYVFFDD